MQGVKVAGLSDLRKELKRLEDSKELQAELREANVAVASMVVEAAKQYAGGVSAQAAAASESLRSSRTLNRAQVLIGSSAVPFALGAEYGSIKFRQFPAWRGNGEDAGYFLWPTIREKRDEIVETYGDAIEALSGKAFPD